MVAYICHSVRFFDKVMEDSSEPFFITAGVMGSLASALTLGTGILFPSMWKNKIYFQMVMMIALCCLMASILFSFGFLDSREVCSIQGTLIVFFYRCSWCWALAIAYQLYIMVKYDRIGIDFMVLNAIIWIPNIILEALPLLVHGTDTIYYGDDDNYTAKTFYECTFKKEEDMTSYQTWSFVLIFVPLLSCIFFMCVLYCYTMRLYFYLSFEITEEVRLHHIDGSEYSDRETSIRQAKLDKITNVLTTMKAYPAILTMCWSPLLLFAIVLGSVQNSDDSYYYFHICEYVSLCVASLSGLCFSCVFFYSSREARARWCKLFNFCYKYCFTDGSNTRSDSTAGNNDVLQSFLDIDDDDRDEYEHDNDTGYIIAHHGYTFLKDGGQEEDSDETTNRILNSVGTEKRDEQLAVDETQSESTTASWFNQYLPVSLRKNLPWNNEMTANRNGNEVKSDMDGDKIEKEEHEEEEEKEQTASRASSSLEGGRGPTGIGRFKVHRGDSTSTWEDFDEDHYSEE